MFELVWRVVRHGLRSYPRAMAELSAYDVAAELRRRLPGLGVEKQHQLLYYCQGHHLATFGEPLFVETISAWDMGPVVADVWYGENSGDRAERFMTGRMTEAHLNTVGYVVSRYGSLSGTDLERLTRNEPPWRDADAGRSCAGPVTIPVSAIRDYFLSADDDRGDDTIPSPDDDVVAEWLSTVQREPASELHPDSLDDLRARFLRG
jgi:uncharacterized phage-associated protein